MTFPQSVDLEVDYDDFLLSQAREIARRRLRRLGRLKTPSETNTFLKDSFLGLDVEQFVIVFLDNRHQVIAVEVVAEGTVDGATVFPWEVVKRTLTLNAAALILAHNHPSGIVEPSGADRRITRRLVDAMALIDVRVLDHIVIGNDTTVSFAERGLI